MGFKVSYLVLSSVLSLSLFPVLLNARGNGYFPQDSSPPSQDMEPESSSTFRSFPMSQSLPRPQPRHLSLASIGKVTETLGALNTLGKYLLKNSNSPGPMPDVSIMDKESTTLMETDDDSSDSESSEESDEKNDDNGNEYELEGAASQSDEKMFPHLQSEPHLKDAIEDEQLGNALYTLGRNVLGRNVNDRLGPVMQTMKRIGKFLPPLVYSNGRIILGSSSNATQDGCSIKDTICTTPAGYPGKCLDLSGCPSLLFDLSNLRKSLCFKALFIPGVCCPDPPQEKPPSTKPTPPTVLITSRPTILGTRPPPVVEENVTTTVIPELFPNLSNNSRDRGCGKSEALRYRIVDGDEAAPGQWPWMAAIFLHGPKGQEFWCGGSLISKRYILTAAHCTKDHKQKSFSPRQFTVRLGEYDLVQDESYNTPQTFRVTEIIAHKDFSGVGFYNDLALLKLERDVDFSRYISPICLPTATGTGTGIGTGRSGSNSFVGTTPTVIGWGTGKYGGRETTALQQVDLPVWSNADCDRAYFQPITDIFLCAGYPQGGKDACQGDSGGPLMLELDGRWVQIGVVSFGNRCAEPGYPGVYTRVTQFLSWIEKNTI